MTLVSLTYCTRFLASTSSNPCCSRTLIIDVLPKLLLTPTSSLKRTKPLIHDQIRSYTKDNEPNTSRRNERPSIYQLEHVQKRLEFTVLYKAIKIYISNFFQVPYLFQYHLDYTFYRDDVVLKDDILKLERRFSFFLPVGIKFLECHYTSNYQGVVISQELLWTCSIFWHVLFSIHARPGISRICKNTTIPNRFKALNIYPIQDDGTVRLRWRIFYVTYFQFIPILYYRVFKKVDLMEKRVKFQQSN